MSAIITQNGNAYVEGLSDGWIPSARMEGADAGRTGTRLATLLTPDDVLMYTTGVKDASWLARNGSDLNST